MAPHIFSISCECIMYLTTWLLLENDGRFWIDLSLSISKHLREVHNFFPKKLIFSSLAKIVCLHILTIATKNRLSIVYYSFSTSLFEGLPMVMYTQKFVWKTNISQPLTYTHMRVVGFEIPISPWKFIRGHPLSTYAKFSEKLTFLTSWYAHVRVCSFSENFAYVLNGRFQYRLIHLKLFTTQLCIESHLISRFCT